MATVAPGRSIVRFATFEVDFNKGELRQKGLTVRIQEQPFRILAALLERPGEIVSREQLRERLWPSNTFVDFEHSVNAAIKKLRQALQDDADSPRFVETVPKRGYRFIAPVESRDPLAAPLLELAVPSATKRDRRWLLGVGAVAIILAATGYFIARGRQLPRATPPRAMLAALPFQNYSPGVEQEYLADGLTEEMIAQLGSLNPERLGVIARTSAMKYKGTHASVDQIGKELGVDYVLEGSIRTEGDRVRVTAQLIRVRDQTHLWARNYERNHGGILTMQQEVASAIANEIQVELSPQHQQRLAALQFSDPRAHEAYARGRFFWNKRTDADLQTAIQYFDEVLQYEPKYALAYSGLADAYFYRSYAWGSLPPREGMAKSKSAARKALELAPDLAEAHTSMALVKLFYEWDWAAAEAEFKKAIELNPNYPTAHHGYAVLLLAVYGRREDAVAEANRALELDPLSVPLNNIVAVILVESRRYDEAIARSNKLHELSPHMPEPYSYMSSAYEAKGDYGSAMDAALKAHSLGGASEQDLAQLREAYATGGMARFRQAEAQATIARAKLHPPQSILERLDLAGAYARVGNSSAALDILDRVADERSGMAVWTKIDYSHVPGIASDARFQALLRRIGLPQ